MQDTPQALKRVRSDQQGTVARVERLRLRRQGRRKGRNIFRCGFARKNPRGRRRRKEGEFILGTARNGRDGRRLRHGSGFGHAAFQPPATAAGRGFLRACQRRLRGGRNLRPHEQQAEENGVEPFHAVILAQGAHGAPTISPDTDYFLAFAAASASSSFLRYLAGLLLKSLRQPLQQSCTSRPSCV